MSIIDEIIGVMAPHSCLACGQEGRLVCPACVHKYLSDVPECRLEPGSVLQSVAAAVSYEGVAKDLVWQLKFQGAQAAAAVMAERMARLAQPDNHPLVVPVPTATRRVRQRGYDQARLLAREVAKRAKLPYSDCLQRHGQAHQVGASRRERLSQLQTAFRLKSSYLTPGDKVILVDDVLTTGATLEAAAAVLRAAGIRQIDAIVFAAA